ncbi:hypothetical protein [Daejeonella oryzae]|uniref:hypothetical protein n=1 Tax=Daejeonella oryzae TaxID=1122943 RepID=UPI000407108E|nr:hypothetical protein [Daejeonella oryzae]
MTKYTAKHFLSFFLLLGFLCTSAIAQDTLKTSDPTISGQYNELIKKSKNNNQGYKIINPVRLQTFKRNLTDSLNTSRQKLAEAISQLNDQNKQINTLNAGIKTKEENLSKSEDLINQIEFLGMPVNKSTYSMVMWGVLFLLAAALAFTLFQSQSYRKEARYRIKLFSDLSEEFQTYKIKANEKEKRLARELQTEKNRVDELTAR